MHFFIIKYVDLEVIFFTINLDPNYFLFFHNRKTNIFNN